jgi:hypothetical protein
MRIALVFQSDQDLSFNYWVPLQVQWGGISSEVCCSAPGPGAIFQEPLL